MIAGRGESQHYSLWLAIKTVSLIAIYAAYGLLQERIIKGGYKNTTRGETSDDNVSSAPFLVLCNRLMSLTTGLVLVELRPANAESSLLPSTTSTSWRPQTWTRTMSARVARLRPASPFLYYALVAGLNNAATLSQYASLSYLSFTTSTLGKSAKMVPILILGYVVYGKRYKTRQWIGAGVVVLGIWGYLTSLPKVDINEEEQKKVVTTNWRGLACLLAYLFFDGLTSNIQERIFGKAQLGEETPTLMGITGGVIDQMVCLRLDPCTNADTSPRYGSIFSLLSLRAACSSSVLQPRQPLSSNSHWRLRLSNCTF